MTDEEVQALQAELETTRTELESIKAEKEGLAASLEGQKAYVATFDQTVADKDTEIATLKQSFIQMVKDKEAEKATLALTIKAETQSFSERRIKDLTASYSEAVSAYKAVLSSANPAVPVHLITGDTIEAIDASLESATALVTQVRQSVEAEIAAGKVPAGAPARTAPDLSTLSPREKIAHAVLHK